MSSVHQPKSKRRKMRAFKLEEISVVDKPAQAGAVATILKRGHVVINPRGTEMTTYQLLKRQMRELDAKLDAVLKVTDLRNQERAAPYLAEEEYEVYPGGKEFEKEPEDNEEEDEEPTDENEGRGGVAYQGKPHRGDWPPGSADRSPGKGPPKGTRADDYVSDDESDEHGQMTPERASEVLQRYANQEDEDEDEQLEELQDTTHKFAQRLVRQFPGASNASIEKMVEAALHSSHSSFDPMFGREREYLKRAAERDQSHVRKTYSDEELLDRLEKRFGATFEDNFDKNFSKYFRR